MSARSRSTRAAAALLSATTLVIGGLTVAASSATAAEGCRVDYTVQNQWPGGFQGDVKVTNLGSSISSWKVAWTWPSSEQKIQQAWNADVVTSGSQVSATSVGWNGSLGTGASASFGFIGTSGSANPAPTSFTVNGVACTGTVPTTNPTTPTQTPTPTRTPTQTPSPTPTPTTTPPPQPSGDLYVDTENQSYAAWQAASGSTKDLLAKIALTPQSVWIGNWNSPSVSQQQMRDATSRASAAGKTVSVVIYAIPGRDCGSHSGGGVPESEYAQWVDTVARGIVGRPIIVLEPDALAQLGDCSGQGDRVGFLKYAAKSLTQAGGRVYIDAGHSGWLSVDTAVSRLNQIGFEYAVGFALNTSNYQTTSDTQRYGEQISQRLGGRGYVIDTSRNGNGSNGEWCNPRGRALGDKPRLVNDSTGLDALLWVKLPGESDGSCNGGPAAGQWWQEIALELARNAKW